MSIRANSHLRLMQGLRCTSTDSNKATNLVNGMQRFCFGNVTPIYRNYSNSYSSNSKNDLKCINDKSANVAHNESNSQPSEQTSSSSSTSEASTSNVDGVNSQSKEYVFNGKTYPSYSSMIDGYLRDMREYNRTLDQTIVRLKRRLFLQGVLLERELQLEKIQMLF